MRLTVVATGSTGNCYLLESDNGQVVLLDAGVSYPRIRRALHDDTRRITSALITHEHMDHAKAVNSLVYAGIPVHTTPGTMMSLYSQHPNMMLLPTLTKRSVNGWCRIETGEWRVYPFATFHDSAEPVGFLLTSGDHKVLYATDTHHLPYTFYGITHMIIECNYITDILLQNIEAGRVTAALKKRLLTSHLSLETLIRFLKSIDLSKCVKIILVHLSTINSNEERMVREIESLTGISTVAASKGMEIDFSLTPF